MHIKFVYHLFVYLSALSLLACTADEMVLTVGDNVIDDSHEACYTEDFEVSCTTQMAEYVATNNTAVALCGSYSDDYIGEITTNTVFKIAPDVDTDNEKFTATTVFDSLVLIMIPNGYIYGDSTKMVNLTLHRLLEDYDYDTLRTNLDEDGLYKCKTNLSTTPYDPSVLTNISFIPEYYTDDTMSFKLPDELGRSWFNKIVADDDNFVNDDKFVKNILNGLTIRGGTGNNAVVGFDMPDNTTDSPDPGIFVRLYYHNVAPFIDDYLDFTTYDEDLQYNQITADFSKGLLNGITPGGDGIPSTETNGLTFVQSGLGLMTKINIPTLYHLYDFGKDLVILYMDLNFVVLPRSFDGCFPLPTDMTMEKLNNNGKIDEDGLTDLSGSAVSISNTYSATYESEYSIPITYYGYLEQAYLETNVSKHSSLLLTAREDGDFVPNINRMIIGDGDNDECKMTVKMYYTTFE